MKTFSKGELVSEAGPDSPRQLVILLQGNIGVYKHYGLTHEHLVTVLGQGSFHGEQALFQNREQTETLVALSDVVVMFVDRKAAPAFIASRPELTINIIKGICKKLEDLTATVERFQRSQLTQTASKRSTFFPEGHGTYLLPLDNSNDYYLYDKKYTCPLCGHAFDTLAFISTRLTLDRVDPDLRLRYKDFEPMYYDIVTCPNCYYSAMHDTFETASKRMADEVNQVIGPHKLELDLHAGAERDTFTVFAGYYLAILCAPVVFDNHQLITANLWLALGRLYQDCNHDQMYQYASEKALEDYRYTYRYLNISEKANQRLCYLMGDLYFRGGDLDSARNFFHMAKTNKIGTTVIRRQADIRLDEIRELKQLAKSMEE